MVFPSTRTYAAAVLVLVTAVACGDDGVTPTSPPYPPRPDAGPPDAGPPTPPDTTAPTLLHRTPEEGDDNVWGGAPIRLVFSERLAPKSVTDAAVTVQSEAGPIAKRTTLSDDGREIHVVIESPHLGPAQLSVTVASTVTDVAGNAFSGANWSFGVPLWQRPGGAVTASGAGPLRPAFALDPAENPVVVWHDGTAIHVAHLSDGKWQRLGPEVTSDAAAAPRIAVTSRNEPIVAFQNNEKHVYVKRHQNSGWEAMGTGPVDAGAGSEAGEPVLSIDKDDRPVVAWIQDKTRVEIRRWEGNSWQAPVAAWEAGVTISDLALALEATSPIVAVAAKGASSSDVRVVRFRSDATSWQPLGAPLDHAIDDAATRPSLAVSRDGLVGVAWQENDGYSDNVYASAYDAVAGVWRSWDKALDVELDAQAVAPSLGFARDGKPMVAWSEMSAAVPRTYVGRFNGARWEVPGSGLDPADARSSASATLVVDSADNPVLVWESRAEGEGGAMAEVQARRYNGGAALRFGIAERRPAPCKFPEQDAPDFPRTLTETKCFTDVPRRIPAPGLIPYDVNSALWSDGALKRRFIILPDGATMGFTDKFNWILPVGAILVKEFLIEREPGNSATIIPMETRFFIKRCESGLCRSAWEGYSYQWNDAGTEATLLTNGNETIFKEWPSGAAKHRHSYPGRDECRQCHANAAGGVLGLQTPQMNRNFDYGGVVDNQLRALAHIGAFGSGSSPDGGVPDGGVPSDALAPDGASSDVSTEGGAATSDASPDGASADGRPSTDGGATGGNDFPFGSLTTLPRLPVPGDPAYSLNERVRSYFHTNCSHCHRPDGRWPVIDFLYDAPLISEQEPNANICNELVPGNADVSRLYIKDATRTDNLPPDFVGAPMPPLATLVPDHRQLPVLKRWINEMKSCP